MSDDARTDHRCDLPHRDPEDRTSWSTRRWNCPDCGIRWIYVQRMIGRKIRGEWRRMPGQPSELDQSRAEVDRLRAELDRHRVAGDAMADELDQSTGISDPDVQRLTHAWRSVRGDAPAEGDAR